MIPATPTLPTVIITPSTPLYPIPSRTAYKYTPTPIASSSSSTSRPSTRKQHLVSALELGPALFPKSETYDEKPSQSLLLPSPASANTHKPRRRAKGVLLSLLVLGIFALVLVGPVMPYRWYAGNSGAEGPAIEAEESVWTLATPPSVAEQASTMDVTGIGKRWDLYASGRHNSESRRNVVVESQSWRSVVQHGLEWAMLD